MMKKYIFIILFASAGALSSAQQLPIYSQHLLNSFMINPAIAGSDGYTSVNLTSRQQWIGLKGAPEINSLSFQHRFIKRGYVLKTRRSGRKIFRPQTDGRIGMGGYLYTYNSGLVQRTGFQASYVYNTWLHRTTQLSLSMGITGYHFRIKEDEVDFEIQEDPVLANGLRRGIFVPDATFGAFFLHERYSFGFSADQLLGGIVRIGSKAYSNYRMDRHYYLMGSYNIFIGKDVVIKPSVLMKMSEQLKPQADLGLSYTFDNYKNAYWAGLKYRTGGAIIAHFGVRADNLFLGYAFDFSLLEVQRFTYGTHEFSVAFKLGAPSKRFRWMNRY